MQNHPLRLLLALTLTIAVGIPRLGIPAAAAASTPADKCEFGKSKAAGKYWACRHVAEGRYALSADATARDAALAKCVDKLAATWTKLEQKASDAGSSCPSSGDVSAVQAVIDVHANNVATALGGGALVNCAADIAVCASSLGTCTGNLTSCNGNLSSCTTNLGTCSSSLTSVQSSLTTCAGDLVSCTGNLASTQSSLGSCNDDAAACAADLGVCEVDLSNCQAGIGGALGQRTRTGQSTCFDNGGAVVACAGTGQDGEKRSGLTPSFVDNNNGTVTDQRTGLVWEKLSDDGSIHDQDVAYTWTNAMAVKIAALNGASFAGFSDWRLPNRTELSTLQDLEVVNPSVRSPFNSGCTPLCTVTSCSCTRSAPYWTSTSYGTSWAWLANFADGDTIANPKAANNLVRAVRGG